MPNLGTATVGDLTIEGIQSISYEDTIKDFIKKACPVFDDLSPEANKVVKKLYDYMKNNKFHKSKSGSVRSKLLSPASFFPRESSFKHGITNNESLAKAKLQIAYKAIDLLKEKYEISGVKKFVGKASEYFRVLYPTIGLDGNEKNVRPTGKLEKAVGLDAVTKIMKKNLKKQYDDDSINEDLVNPYLQDTFPGPVQKT